MCFATRATLVRVVNFGPALLFYEWRGDGNFRFGVDWKHWQWCEVRGWCAGVDDFQLFGNSSRRQVGGVGAFV